MMHMMRGTSVLTAARKIAKQFQIGVLVAVGALCLHSNAAADLILVDLGTASDFAVLAGAGITVAGPVDSTTITGDIGTYPTLTISGLANVVLNGVNHGGDAITQAAQADQVTAYNDAAGRVPTTSFGPIFDLGGLTLTSGVYNGSSSFGLTGILTLDAQGDPNAVWIFQAGSTLITASDSTVALIGGAQASHVFWQVGSSATLGTGTDFAGSILALEAATLNTGATVDGRVLAQNAAVTLDNNIITVPEAGTFLLLGSGLAALGALRRRRGFGSL